MSLLWADIPASRFRHMSLGEELQCLLPHVCTVPRVKGPPS